MEDAARSHVLIAAIRRLDDDGSTLASFRRNSVRIAIYRKSVLALPASVCHVSRGRQQHLTPNHAKALQYEAHTPSRTE